MGNGIARPLRAAMESAGVDPAELAARLNDIRDGDPSASMYTVLPHHIRRYLAGSDIKAERLRQICEALDVSPNTLLEWDE